MKPYEFIVLNNIPYRFICNDCQKSVKCFCTSPCKLSHETCAICIEIRTAPLVVARREDRGRGFRDLLTGKFKDGRG